MHGLHNGALRVYDQEFLILRACTDAEVVDMELLAEDAFGTKFCYPLSDCDEVVVYHPEISRLEPLGITRKEFYALAEEEPDALVPLQEYQEAVDQLGQPELNQHFALKIELSRGGDLAPSNLFIMDTGEHQAMLGHIADSVWTHGACVHHGLVHREQ